MKRLVEIDSKENYEYYKRCILAQQLNSYRYITRAWQNLERLEKMEQDRLPKIVNLNIVNPVSEILAQHKDELAVGDTKFMDTKDFQTTLEKMASGYSKREKPDIGVAVVDEFERSLRLLAKHNLNHRAFKEAESKLSECISPDGTIDSKKVSTYHRFMQNGQIPIIPESQDLLSEGIYTHCPALKNFDDEISGHLKMQFGHKSLMMVRNSYKELKDANPENAKTSSYSKANPSTTAYSKVNPSHFHADIHGFFRPRVVDRESLESTTPPELVNGLQDDSKNYSPRLTPILDSGARFFNSASGKKKSLAALIMAGTLAFGGYNVASSVNNYMGISTDTAAEQGYVLEDMSNVEGIYEKLQEGMSAAEALDFIEQEIEELKNSPTLPTQSDINTIKDHLDTTFDTITGELIVRAAEKQGITVLSTSNYFDKSNVDNDLPTNWTTVEYLDKNGDTQTARVESNGKNPLVSLLGDYGATIAGIYNYEEELDTKLKKQINEIYNSDSNFDEKADAINKILDTFSEMCENGKIVAAHDANLKLNEGFLRNSSISLKNPQKAETTDETTVSQIDIDDDGR